MRKNRTGMALAGIFAVAACVSAPEQAPTVADGWTRYTENRVRATYACGELPVLLEGNRSIVTLTGGCQHVRVAGARNDVHVEVAPGGLIEITGDHNDVWWQQTSPGAGPRLESPGKSNDFHREGS